MDTMIMKMPAVALRGMVILPGMVAHFDVSRAKSIKAVEEAMMDEQKIFLWHRKTWNRKILISRTYLRSGSLLR